MKLRLEAKTRDSCFVEARTGVFVVQKGKTIGLFVKALCRKSTRAAVNFQ